MLLSVHSHVDVCGYVCPCKSVRVSGKWLATALPVKTFFGGQYAQGGGLWMVLRTPWSLAMPLTCGSSSHWWVESRQTLRNCSCPEEC